MIKTHSKTPNTLFLKGSVAVNLSSKNRYSKKENIYGHKYRVI